jgi:prepilin-type N-terminal cleavage/methylation domain-containing protein
MRRASSHRPEVTRPGAGRRRGFTLVEAVATIVVLGALGTAASSILLSATDSYLDAATAAQLHSEASIAMDRAVREVRKIALDSSATSIAPDIDSVTASSITWDTTSSLSLSGTNLMLAVSGGAAAVLQSDVTAFTVQTYNESNTALGTSLSGSGCDPIRRVSLTITVSRGGVTHTVRSKVFVRSTMINAGTS